MIGMKRKRACLLEVWKGEEGEKGVEVWVMGWSASAYGEYRKEDDRRFTPSVEERRGRTAAVSRHDGVVCEEAAGGGEEGVEYDEEEQIGEGW